MWWRFIRIKLPLFFLPLAFAGKWQLTPKQWRTIAFSFILLVFLACCWSLWKYFENIQVINKGYLRAKVIPTPLENDHVRFSLVVCTAIICSALLIRDFIQKNVKILLVFFIVLFTIYLHILSARTGLICLYIFFVLYFFYLLVSLKKIKWVIALSIAILLMPVASWFFLPTFQNRIRYIIYDFSYLKKEIYLPGSNDGNRMLSLKAGYEILKENPLGVGCGDLINETNLWYRKYIPGMLESDKYFPSSEWLMYGGTAGWPGIFLFTLIMIIPFFQKNMARRFFWFSLNTIAVLSFLFDIGLEVQFGVFIYAFTVLWWWKWLHKEFNAGITQ